MCVSEYDYECSLQVAAECPHDFFLCKVGMKRLFGKGTLRLAPKIFQKNGRAFAFFHAARVKIFWAFP